MTKAEKYAAMAANNEAIAANVPKVYSAGQSSMVDESKLIPKTVSGVYISVDDVSEIPHKVACRVESVNLFGLELITGTDGNGYTIDNDVITNNMAIYNRTYWLAVKPFQLCAGSYRLAFDARKNRPDGHLNMCTRLRFSDGSVTGIETNSVRLTNYETWEHLTVANPFVLETDRTVTGIAIICTGMKSGTVDDTSDAQLQFKNIMLNRGATALPYTPYVKPEEVKVTRCGRNLFDVNGYDTTVENCRYRLKPNTAYTLSSNCPKFTTTASIYFNGGSSLANGVCVDTPRTTVTDENGYLYISLRTKPTTSDPLKETYNAYGLLKSGEYWVQLEEGTTATEYEPYTGQTLIPSADGTVEGMTSVSPYMNVFSDTEGVNIEATYNKSYGMQTEYDRFWDAYQWDGTRPYYNYAFSYAWRGATYNPKYPFGEVLQCAAMFYYSKVTDTKIDIDISKATNIQMMFEQATALHTIRKLIVAEDRVLHVSNFRGATALANITFEGVIGCSLNFQWCPLTLESATSVINALKDYSGTDKAGTNTVTFSSTTKNLLTEAGEIFNGMTWNNYVSAIGWNV